LVEIELVMLLSALESWFGIDLGFDDDEFDDDEDDVAPFHWFLPRLLCGRGLSEQQSRQLGQNRKKLTGIKTEIVLCAL